MQPSQQYDRLLFKTAVAAAAVLLLALAAPLMTGRVYVADDLGEFHLPARAFYSACLQSGQNFDWWPQLHAGLFLTGEGQAGTYHPLHLLLYRCLPLDAAFGLEIWLNYPLLFVGSYLWLRRRLRRRGAAACGALLFTFSGFNLLHFVHVNAIAVVAHLPWNLWLIDIALRETKPLRRAGACAAIALLTGSQLLLGYPQYVWFSLVAEGFYALLLPTAGGQKLPRLATVLVAKLVGLLIGAVQWLPTLDALRHSNRQFATAEFLENGSLHPLNLVQLVAPYLFENRVVGQNTHELGLYVGAVPLVLITWLVCRTAGKWPRTWLIGFSVVLGAIAIVMALGSYGPAYRLQTWLPIVGKFRFPARMIVLFHLAIAGIAGAALLKLARQRSDAQSQRTWPLYLPAAAGLIVLSVALIVWRPHVAGNALPWVGPFLLAIAAWLVVQAERSKRWAFVLLVVFAAADLASYGFSYSIWGQTSLLDEYAQAPLKSSVPPGNLMAFESKGDGVRGPQLGNRVLLAGWRRVDGYVGLTPLKTLDYQDPSVLRMAGVHWQARLAADEDTGGLLLRPVQGPLPEFRLVTNVVAGSPSAATVRGMDFDHSALVAAPLILPRGEPGTVTVTSNQPGRIALQVETPTRQLLTVAQSFHSGWRAAIDGTATAVWRVNGDFLGCVVPAGQHEVRLDFQPSSLKQGMKLTFCGLGLLVCGFFATWIRSSRHD